MDSVRVISIGSCIDGMCVSRYVFNRDFGRYTLLTVNLPGGGGGHCRMATNYFIRSSDTNRSKKRYPCCDFLFLYIFSFNRHQQIREAYFIAFNFLYNLFNLSSHAFGFLMRFMKFSFYFSILHRLSTYMEFRRPNIAAGFFFNS